MRKLYWITFFFGILVISVVTILVETTVNYYSEVKYRGIYCLGIGVGVILNALFQEILFLKQKYSKKGVVK